MSNFGVENLRISNAWLIDGTFKSVPSGFFNLFRYMGSYLEKLILYRLFL
jgi:hypothetical protein